MKDIRFRSSYPVDQTRLNPMPFPGIYPTRWSIKLDWNPGFSRKGAHKAKTRPSRFTHSFVYQGKPTSAIALRVFQIYANYVSWLEVVEYDRGGPIMGTSNGTPQGNMIGVRYWAEPLVRFYHPWSGSNTGEMVSSWIKGLNRLPITYKDRKFTIYCPYKDFNNMLGDPLRDHFVWLESANLQFLKK